MDDDMSDHIECPHCNGSGKVAEDFLTDKHVREVFSDYCETFHIHKAYGVESYSDGYDHVNVLQDTSARSCYNNESHSLPRAYFTRNRDHRLAIMRSDFAAQQEAEAKRRLAKEAAELASLEARVAALRQKLGGPT